MKVHKEHGLGKQMQKGMIVKNSTLLFKLKLKLIYLITQDTVFDSRYAWF